MGRLSNTTLNEHHDAFAWSSGYSFGCKFDNNTLLSVGFQFGNNALYYQSYETTAVPASSETDSKSNDILEDIGAAMNPSGGILRKVFANLTTLQIPVKVGVWKEIDDSGVDLFANVGSTAEILLDRHFYYNTYPLVAKNRFAVGLLAEAGVAIEFKKHLYLTLSTLYLRNLTSYSNQLDNQQYTRWSAGLNVGLLYMLH